MNSLKRLLTRHGDSFFDGNFGGLLDFVVPRGVALDMVKQVISEEIKSTFFDMDNNKTPGSDGFGALFYKKAWDIIGKDVVEAIKYFFALGSLLLRGQ